MACEERGDAQRLVGERANFGDALAEAFRGAGSKPRQDAEASSVADGRAGGEEGSVLGGAGKRVGLHELRESDPHHPWTERLVLCCAVHRRE